jgi:hypothetical protein
VTNPNPLDPVAGERLSHAGKIFTSDLSITSLRYCTVPGSNPSNW